LDLARGVARRLRAELIYGMPTEAQVYEEQAVPTSRNLPMFMEFVFKLDFSHSRRVANRVG
jgi:hypothetical protein